MGNADFIYKIAMIFAVLLCSIKIFLDLAKGFNRNRLIEIFIFCCILLINYFINLDVTFLISMFFFLAIKNVSLKKIFKYMLLGKIIGYFFSIILFLLDFRKAKVVEFYRDGFIERNDLGLGHPNYTHFVFLSILLLIVVIYFKYLKFWQVLIFLLINHLIYIYTGSRTGYYNIILLFIFYYMIKYNILKKILYFLTKYIQIFLSIFTFLISVVFFEYDFVKVLDKLLTGRVKYSNLQYNMGLSIFGKDFTNTNIIFDNSYSMIFTLYGIIIGFVCILIYTYTSTKIVNKKIDAIVLLMFIISINMFTESYIPSAIINISWFVIAKIYLGDLEDVKKEFT